MFCCQTNLTIYTVCFLLSPISEKIEVRSIITMTEPSRLRRNVTCGRPRSVLFSCHLFHSHMVNTCYRDTQSHCLGGYTAISLACQFQTRKIIHGFRKMFLLIIPIVYLTIIANRECFANYSFSVSVALHINCMHAKCIRYPYRRRQSTFTLCFIRHIYHMLCSVS